MSDPAVSNPEMANWAVAYASQHQKRYLGPALRKAYKKDRSPPDREPMVEALAEARSIVAALERGLEMLGSGPPRNQTAPSGLERPSPDTPSRPGETNPNPSEESA